MRFVTDAQHLHVGFSVRHMGLATVRGLFEKASGEMEIDDAGKVTALKAEVEVGSIETKEKDRNAHLKSADFFDAEHHPKMTYQSQKVEELSGHRFKVHGDLTIRGTARHVDLEVETTDVMNDPYGKKRIGVQITGKINRKDFGLTWNQVLEAGALLVGEDVNIYVEGEATAS